MIEENTLASKLKARGVAFTKTVQTVMVSKNVVDELEKLHKFFVTITEDVKLEAERAIANATISLKRLVSRTMEEKAFYIPEL